MSTDRFDWLNLEKNDQGHVVSPIGRTYKTEGEAIYYDLLGFCGCGDPESTHDFVIECLKRTNFDENKIQLIKLRDLILERPDDAAMMIAYFLSDKGMTEHGGGVGGSWLTSLGEKVIDVGVLVEGDWG